VLRLPVQCGYEVPYSLRIAVIGFVVIVIFFFFFAVVFLFVFFLFWHLSQEEIGRQPIRRVCVGAFWMYCGHGQMVRLVPLGKLSVQ